MAASLTPNYIVPHPEGVLLKVVVQPRASKSQVVGESGEPPRLKIRLAAPPVDGEANEELVRYLKSLFRVPRSSIQIYRGEKSKSKDLLLPGVKLEDAVRILSQEQSG